jgi:hypothetical protein
MEEDNEEDYEEDECICNEVPCIDHDCECTSCHHYRNDNVILSIDNKGNAELEKESDLVYMRKEDIDLMKQFIDRYSKEFENFITELKEKEKRVNGDK